MESRKTDNSTNAHAKRDGGDNAATTDTAKLLAKKKILFILSPHMS